MRRMSKERMLWHAERELAATEAASAEARRIVAAVNAETARAMLSAYGISDAEADIAAAAVLEPLGGVDDPLWRVGLERPSLLIAILMHGNGGLRVREAVGLREAWESPR
jgi:hypothetical protein